MNQIGEARPEKCDRCGDPILAFDVDIFSWSIHLEDHDLPVNADFPYLLRQYRLWEYFGPNLGWTCKYSGDRNWRPLRATHICVDSPYVPLFDSKAAAEAHRAQLRTQDDRPASGGGKQKHKNKKEHAS
jgi:hypothetical protein